MELYQYDETIEVYWLKFNQEIEEENKYQIPAPGSSDITITLEFVNESFV